MMQCGTCNHWVHAKCEDLTGECPSAQTGNFTSPNSSELNKHNIREAPSWTGEVTVTLEWIPNSRLTISDELYEILSSLPESVVYSCRPCSVTQPSAWRELLYIELRAGVEKVLACLLSSTLTQHLVTCSQVESPPVCVFCFFFRFKRSFKCLLSANVLEIIHSVRSWVTLTVD